jgi:hypothetical protein
MHEGGSAGCAGHPSDGLWFGNRRQFTGERHAQPNRFADPFAFPNAVIKPLTERVAFAVACAKSGIGMSPAAGRNLIQGDDHRRSRGLACGL